MTAEQCAEVLARMKFSSDLGAVADADIVIESAVEDEAAKIDLLKKLEAKMHPEAVLGTNTSSLRLETLGKALSRADRFVGLHFFSPVPAMELVELGGIEQTGDYALQRAEAFCKQIGKTAGAHQGLARLCRQPPARAVPVARHRDARVGHRQRRRHRHGDEARLRPPDGSARAQRPDRPRHRVRDGRDDGARAQGRPLSHPAHARSSCSRPSSSAARASIGIFVTTAARRRS